MYKLLVLNLFVTLILLAQFKSMNFLKLMLFIIPYSFIKIYEICNEFNNDNNRIFHSIRQLKISHLFFCPHVYILHLKYCKV